MNRSGNNDRMAGFHAGLSRRSALGFGAAALLSATGLARAAPNDADISDDVLSAELVLRDPAIPVAGNPNGDITIVEFTDAQCGYCRKVAPDLRQVVEEDGKIRLVIKDWPILGPVSVYAAQMSLATRYQNKFIPAHDAVMALKSKLTEQAVRDALASAGVDVARASADLEKNRDAIKAVLKRIDAQATAFGFQGTPSFIVGKFRIPGPLSKEHFALAVADARKAEASGR